MRKQRRRSALLISAFVFATRIVQSLYLINLKFQASSSLLWLWFVWDLVGNPEDRFSVVTAHITMVSGCYREFMLTLRKHVRAIYCNISRL